jgi:hypothetical protein
MQVLSGYQTIGSIHSGDFYYLVRTIHFALFKSVSHIILNHKESSKV